MVDCKSISTPVDTQVKVSAESEPPVADLTHFRSLVEALQYIVSRSSAEAEYWVVANGVVEAC
jgi:hypothetical protein